MPTDNAAIMGGAGGTFVIRDTQTPIIKQKNEIVKKISKPIIVEEKPKPKYSFL